jgi:hypothetical protein
MGTKIYPGLSNVYQRALQERLSPRGQIPGDSLQDRIFDEAKKRAGMPNPRYVRLASDVQVKSPTVFAMTVKVLRDNPRARNDADAFIMRQVQIELGPTGLVLPKK